VTRTGFVLQAVRNEDEAAPPRFGFTVTNKVGNAVTRNRIKRRLRELARAAGPDAAPGIDYVLVGRREAIDRPFDAMTADLASAMTEIVKMRRLAEPRTSPRGAR
jgi:ribonuclease P protein component